MGPRARNTIVAATLLVFGGCYAFERQQLADENERLRAEMAALASSVQSVQRVSARPPERLVHRVTVDRGCESESAPCNSTETPGQPKPPDTDHPEPNELDVYVETKFESERPERAQSVRTSELRQIIVAELPKDSVLVDFECRVSFCRMDVEHKDMRESNSFLYRLTKMGGPLTDKYSGVQSSEGEDTGSGRMRYVVFIGMPGVPLTPPLPGAPTPGN